MINEKHPGLMGSICVQSYIYDPIVDPIDTLNAFFDYRDLVVHLEALSSWKHLVETNAYAEISTERNLLFDHRMIGNLLNATFMLHEMKIDSDFSLRTLSEKEQNLFLNSESLVIGDYPRHLDVSMLIDPMLGIKKVFEYFTLQQYHEQMYEWLNAALCPNVRLEDEDLVETMYRNLRVLMESAWLICHRMKCGGVFGNGSPVCEQVLGGNELEAEIPAHVLAQFKKFLGIVPAARLNRSLRKMLIDYLFYNLDGLPKDFEESLSDFYWLTDLLDEIQGKAVDTKFL